MRLTGSDCPNQHCVWHPFAAFRGQVPCLGNTLRHGHRRDAAGLDAHDSSGTAATPGLLQNVLWHLRTRGSHTCGTSRRQSPCLHVHSISTYEPHAGCVRHTRPGTWVVFPQPVSPATSTTWCAATAFRMPSRCSAMGNAAREAARVATSACPCRCFHAACLPFTCTHDTAVYESSWHQSLSRSRLMFIGLFLYDCWRRTGSAARQTCCRASQCASSDERLAASLPPRLFCFFAAL